MNGWQLALRQYFAQWIALWDRFWFRPADPATLGLIRVLAGAVIFYTHLVWSRELHTFFGSQAIIPPLYRSEFVEGQHFIWSHFDWLPSDAFLWPVHLIALAIMFCFMIGLWTRVTGVLTALLVISYANRATGAQFGLDQINGFLAMYLAIGPAGEFLSVDQWLRTRGRAGESVRESIPANISLRLIQVHMCVVYLFAGLGKLQGDTWWLGQAIWLSFASYEYQTLDFTWLAGHMAIINLMTYATLVWEVCYPFLIWPRLTRPLFLIGAILVHAGIGLAMGMLTFGIIMITGNLAFLPSPWVRSIWESIILRRA